MALIKLEVKLRQKVVNNKQFFSIMCNGVFKKCHMHDKSCDSECAAFGMSQTSSLSTVQLACLPNVVTYRFYTDGLLKELK